MKRIVLALVLAASVAGCAGFQKTLEIATGVYTYAQEPVPANVVIPTANAFNILKAGATNYGTYCIQQNMVPAVCSPDFRRNVVRAVRAGTNARNQMVGSLERGEPAGATVYNALVSAVNGLKSSPAANAQFAGATP